ncbi:glutathione transferase GST 23 [Lolium perenne]|uniref:glutathione transferase GST 23 n=1 Tax=Lolium perenne TaxID=4522 RepID=UPI0021EB0F8E|nr:glutathione transferase GST 23-like [Lolium perenne]
MYAQSWSSDRALDQLAQHHLDLPAMDHQQEEKVQLLGMWASPYVYKVKWALSIKGVEYEYVEEDLRNKSSQLLEHNPVHKKVPVLVYNGKPVAESDVIIEFIEDAWKGHGGRILPEDPHERAMARFWVRFVPDKLSPRIWKWFTTAGGEEQDAAREASVEQLQVLEEKLTLGGNEFFGGDSVGLVDLSLGALAYVIPMYEEIIGERLVTEDMFPSLYAWMGRFLAAPPVKDHLPPMEELKLRFRAMREYFVKNSA